MTNPYSAGVEPETDYLDEDTLTQDLNIGTTVRDDLPNIVKIHETGIALVRLAPARQANMGNIHLNAGQSAMLVGRLEQRTRLVVRSFGVNISLATTRNVADQDGVNAATPALWQGFILGDPFVTEIFHNGAVFVAAFVDNTIVSYLQEFQEG